MTEEEARDKWCPHVARDPRDGDSIAFGQCCIGSQCMAWRWDMEWASSTEEGSGGDVVLRLKRLKGEPKQGYCGLAGKP